MPTAPISLGVIASGELYDAWPSASVGSPLDLVTDVDVPVGAIVWVLFRFAPGGNSITDLAISDDSSEPGAANSYVLASFAGSGGFAYNFGRPTFQCPPEFDVGAFAGGSVGGLYRTKLTRPLPSGSTLSVALTYSGSGTTLVSATVLAFTDGQDNSVFLASRGIDPANTSDGNGANIPLGDHTFDELGFANQEMLVAMVWADDVSLDNDLNPVGTPISGSDPVTDTSGLWTKVDSGGEDATSQWGGLAYGVFILDTSAGPLDLTQPIVTFEVNGTTTPSVEENGVQNSGIVMYYLSLNVTPPGIPALNGVIPV